MDTTFAPPHAPEPTAALAELSPEEAACLLAIARAGLAAAVNDVDDAPDLAQLPPRLREPGASFVTLTWHGRLHGCIGSVEPQLPLALDVLKNVAGAALRDPRFPPLASTEVPEVTIEVSVLSPLQALPYRDLADLIRQVRPGVDGVLVARDWQRGLLLPQVWEKLPDPRDFLDHVALKASASISIYDDPDTRVWVFQVHSYHEPRVGGGNGATPPAASGR
ncbi:MAG: AmmeMemoRadiSam system protein A [Caldilineales bacterium]|nr:AmmeMemoRadiSam system protein A [Caldilineales bacterium]